MKRLALVLLLPLVAPAVGAAVAPDAPNPARAEDADLVRVAAWMAGEFDTFAQAARDEAAGAAYKHVRAVLRIVPVTLAGLSDAGRAFYLEQALAEAEDKPYRQRIVLVTRRDGRLVSRLYRLKQPEPLVGAWRDPSRLAALAAGELEPDEGCDLVWTRADEGRSEGVAGAAGSCRSAVRGATHVVSRVVLTAEAITSLDQGQDDDGAHKWGPPPGTPGHVFVRRR